MLEGIRRKLFYVPLAMHLTLQGCATAQLLSPATPPVTAPAAVAAASSQALTAHHGTTLAPAKTVVDSGEHGSHAITIDVHGPNGFNLQSIQHRWIANDVTLYKVLLKVKNEQNTYDDVTSVDLNQKGLNTSQKAAFTGLAEGKTYKVFMQTYGNIGGTTLSTTLIDGQHPQVSDDITFGAPLDTDVEDTYSVTLTPTLDVTAFNGQIGASVALPIDGSFTTTLTPTASAVASVNGLTSVTAGHMFWAYNCCPSISYGTLTWQDGTVTLAYGVSALVGPITGPTSANIPGHTFTVIDSHDFVLDGITYSDNL